MNEKHFLDTSILRPVICSPPKIKEYYKGKLVGKKYICDYIKMEFYRGYIKSLIEFYSLLSMKHYKDFSEALYVWSNNFKIREHKNIEIMLSNLINERKCQNDKETSLKYIADYIRRIIGKVNNIFINTGNDNTKCIKGSHDFKYNNDNPNLSFKEFVDLLNDNEQYKNCKINNFLMKDKNNLVLDIIDKSDKYNDLGKKDGFDRIIDELNNILNKKNKNITCNICSKIGDLIISVLSPDNMILEHTDFSFNYLCKILNKNHFQYPTDKIIHENQTCED